MALTLRTILNFGSGTTYAAAAALGPTIVSSPAHPDKSETYVAKLTASVGAEIVTHSWDRTQNAHAFGFYVWLTDVAPKPNWYLLCVEASKGVTDAKFYFVDGGALAVYDANNNLVTTTGNVLNEGAWNLVRIFLTIDGASSAMVVEVNGAEVIDETNQDFDCGVGSTVQVRFSGQGGLAAKPCDMYVGGAYAYSGATEADFDWLKGDFGCPAYPCDLNSATPNAGDDLDSGQWDDTGDIPWNDGNDARYTASDRKGVVTMPGPYGDSDIADGDAILGASFLVRWYASSLLTGNTFYFHYGKCPQNDPDTDHTTWTDLGASMSIENDLIIATAEAVVPGVGAYFQCGMRTKTGFPAGSIQMKDCLCSLLVQRAGGSSFQLERGMHRGAARGILRGAF